MKLAGNFIPLKRKALVARRALKAGKAVAENYSVSSIRTTPQTPLRELVFASATALILMLVAIFLSYRIAAYCALRFAQEVPKWTDVHLDNLFREIAFGGVTVCFGVAVFFGSFVSLMWLAERAKNYLVDRIFKKTGNKAKSCVMTE